MQEQLSLASDGITENIDELLMDVSEGYLRFECTGKFFGNQTDPYIPSFQTTNQHDHTTVIDISTFIDGETRHRAVWFSVEGNTISAPVLPGVFKPLGPEYLRYEAIGLEYTDNNAVLVGYPMNNSGDALPPIVIDSTNEQLAMIRKGLNRALKQKINSQ